MTGRRSGAVVAALLLAGLAAGWLLLLATPVAARSFELESVITEAVVHADGSMDVIEHLTYDFDGEFNGGTRSIPPGPYQISDLRITEGGTPLEVVSSTPSDIRWRGLGPPGKVTGRHTYDIAYRVIGAVAVAPDVGVLNWRFIGTEFPRVEHVAVTVVLPGNGDGVRAWAHGILEGVITIDGPTVRLAAEHNPAGSLVEVRTTQPASDYTVIPEGEPVLDEIVAEETVLAEDANRLRAELRDEIDADRRKRAVGDVAAPLVAAGGALAFAGVFLRYGREPARPADIGEYWREIPEDPPAVCQAVLTFGNVGNDALPATLLDLAQRGFVTITEEREDRFLRKDKVDYRFTRTEGTAGNLNSYESKLMKKLFVAGDSTTQSELVEDAKADRAASARWMESFKKAISRDVERRNYINRRSGMKWALWLLVILATAGFGVLCVVALDSTWGWLGVAVAAIVMPLGLLLPQRTDAGARKAAEVKGLARFLKHFSRLEDQAYAGDLAIYERYLVYAVALGVADELLEGLRVRFPELADPSTGFAPWYVGGALAGGSGHGDRLSAVGGVGAFASGFGSATAAAFSPPSSSGGGGGGFSGGSSGGGGGGGAGAW